MRAATRAAVLAVGTELLLGDVVNSNAAWLGRQLRDAGLQVVTSAAVADNLDQIVAEMRRCLTVADVLLLSGGLGPTLDDLTRDAVAAWAGVRLERVPALEEQLRERFASYGIAMPDSVLRQADVPVGAEVLDNPVGTAPGLWFERDGKVVVALPGPPHELQATAAPVWSRLPGEVLVTRQVLVAGVGESTVAERVEAVVTPPEDVTRSYLAGGAVVRVRFTGTDPAVLETLVAATAEVLGDAVWGYDDDTLDGVVGDLLRDRGQTVAVAESLTGGLLSSVLTTRPGTSTTFRGGVVVYATDLKATLAGVPQDVLDREGAVSARTAEALAEGARERLSADWGVAVTGVAGPTEQEGIPVGTVHVAVAGPSRIEIRSVRLPGDRDRVRQLTVTTALDLLRRELLREG